MKIQRINKRSTGLFAMLTFVAFFLVTLIPDSQRASAVVVHHKVSVHHKAHAASKGSSFISVHHKVIPVIPEMHGEPTTVGVHKKANSTGDIIGGMIVGGEHGVLGG